MSSLRTAVVSQSINYDQSVNRICTVPPPAQHVYGITATLAYDCNNIHLCSVVLYEGLTRQSPAIADTRAMLALVSHGLCINVLTENICSINHNIVYCQAYMDEITFKGHSKSLPMALIDSLNTISYSSCPLKPCLYLVSFPRYWHVTACDIQVH